MTSAIEQHFSQTYEEARGKFLLASDEAGLPLQCREHPKRGRDGELLAMDIARSGAPEATSLLIISSGCHGVEGFCGSGIQSFMLRDMQWQRFTKQAGVAVLYVHALNPHGFSWWRRTTHENVDLNRNFIDFSAALPPNEGYDEIADWLVPDSWPPAPEVALALDRYVEAHGHAAYQAAASGGQYRHPDGIFYGGNAPTWNNLVVRQLLREHASKASKLAWIDIHTGLGPSGVGEKIFGCRHDDASIARARSWWGKDVTQLDDGSSTSAPLQGLLWHAPHEECPHVEYTALGLEFGTVAIDEMLDALRADQWLENHPDCSSEQRRIIKHQIRDAFYTDTAAWKEQVVEQAMSAATRAVIGMTRD